MATFLKPFRFAWKELDEALNKIAYAVNFNAPLEGAGIHLDEKGGRGTSINWTETKTSSAPSSASQAAAQNIWHGVKWQEVDVMDANCNRSTITVLVYTGDSSDSITIA
jgi:malonyl CoA-acyl carrier protein transacylase